jgi:hypothetical protein
VEINGPQCEADVQPHSRGTVSKKTTTAAFHVHYLVAGTSPFVHFDGIFGMDLLDGFEVDPVEDFAGTSSYLALRV